ncbi:MAG: FAD-dependent monooxygenase [Pirellulales bacterium]
MIAPGAVNYAGQTDPPPADEWDAVVIGAGPAGAVAARQLALAGRRTLLVEAKSFPRHKACGGCLSAAAVAALRSIGLGDALAECPSRETRAMEIWRRGECLRVPLPSGLAVERATLDERLAAAARRSGAVTCFGTSATVAADLGGQRRIVRLNDRHGNTTHVAARMVLAADGLGHPSLGEFDDFACRVAHHARVGVAATVEDPRLAESLTPATIRMVVGSAGYVGMVACAATRVNVAAALDAALLKRCGTPVAAVNHTLAQACRPLTIADGPAHWVGTRPLTQHSSQVAGERIFLLGDAAGYVEPFTGEGMTSAIQSGVVAAELAERGITHWSAELANAWQARYDRHVRPSQRVCSLLAWLSRHALAADVGFRLATCFPTIGALAARHVNFGHQRLGENLP